MKKFIILIFAFFVLSCASLSPQRGLKDNNIWVSESPPLRIQLNRKPLSIKKDVNTDIIKFHTAPAVYITIRRNTSNYDYYYSLSNIISNVHAHYLGKVYFGDHEWAKASKVNKGYLITAYFTRKDDWFIEVYDSIKLNDKGLEAFELYQKTLKLTDADEKFINARFETLDQSVTILE